jgi:hypothetical protein
LAPTSAGPHALQESERTSLNIGAVVASHDGLDSLSCLVGVVEWDSANVVVKYVGFNDTVEKSAADETKLAVNSCGGTTDIVPAFSAVVRESWVGVLKIRDSNLYMSVMTSKHDYCQGSLPSQWFTQIYGRKYQTSILLKP